MDAPEPGVRGSRMAIFPCHLGCSRSSNERISSGLTRSVSYQTESLWHNTDLGFDEIGVVPEAFRLVRLERVNIFLRVVDPDVAAPPLFRVLYLRQDEVRLDGLEDVFREKAGHDRFAAADVDVEIADAGFGLLDDPARDRRAARGNRFDVDAVAFFEAVLERLAQLAGGRDRDDDLAFFLPGFYDALPLDRKTTRLNST